MCFLVLSSLLIYSYESKYIVTEFDGKSYSFYETGKCYVKVERDEKSNIIYINVMEKMNHQNFIELKLMIVQKFQMIRIMKR